MKKLFIFTLTVITVAAAAVALIDLLYKRAVKDAD